MKKDFLKPLKVLKNKHDIISIKIIDLREKVIPDIGLIHLEDEETGEQLLVDTSDKEFQENYKKIIEQTQNQLNNFFKKYEA